MTTIIYIVEQKQNTRHRNKTQDTETKFDDYKQLNRNKRDTARKATRTTSPQVKGPGFDAY
jgi:hypothetical protein